MKIKSIEFNKTLSVQNYILNMLASFYFIFIYFLFLCF